MILQLCHLCDLNTQTIEDELNALGIQYISLSNEQATVLIERLLMPTLTGNHMTLKRCSLLGTVIVGPSITVEGKDYN